MKLSAELQIKLNNLRAEAEALMNKEGVKAEEINAKAEEIKAMKAKVDYQLQVEADEEAERQNAMNNGGAKPLGDSQNQLSIVDKIKAGVSLSDDEHKEYSKIVNKVLRGQKLNEKEFQNYSELTGSQGGFLVPLDEKVMIHEFKRANVFDIMPYVGLEYTDVIKGTRVYEVLADLKEMDNLDEGEEIKDGEESKFTQISYSIHDYADKIKIPNHLLKDNKADLLGYIYRQIAKKVLFHMFRKVMYGKGGSTDCEGLITKLNSLSKTQSLDAAVTLAKLKKVLEVELDPAIAAGCILFMNQDAWNLISDLDEANKNKKFITYDYTQPIPKQFLGRPVVVVANKWMPTRTIGTGTDAKKKADIVIGMLDEAIRAFMRQNLEIASSDVAGDAFTKNLTYIRYILRMDTRIVDPDAVIHLETPIA